MAQHGTENPKFSAALAGNHNQLGIAAQPVGPSFKHPGKVTRGPGANKPRIHLVSSKGKVPAGVIVDAIAFKQKNKVVNPTVNKHPELASELGTADDGMVGNKKGGDPTVKEDQLKNPSGVAKRPAPPHQNNPALAGRFTPQGKAWAAKHNAMTNATSPVVRKAP
jgi:hypothetical protein